MRMRVSLCMIARNEAANLARCLASVADLVDEMVVVDTGSDDNTRIVASELGARVHEFAWVDDFAAARNESVRHATSEWILWLDGDEYLDADNRVRLRSLLHGLGDENAAYLMRQRSLAGSADGDAVFFQCRLFRNLPSISWRYRVHEQIQPAVEGSGGTVRATEVFIEHSGYDDPVVYRRKLDRNARLLSLEDRERPNDPFTLMNLGWTYKNMGQLAAAMAYYERGLAVCKAGVSIACKLHALLVRGHLALGQRQEALAACRAGRREYPDDVELSFLEAALLSELGDLRGAEVLLLRLIESRPADPLAFGANPGMRGHMARHNLARIYRAQGRAAEAEAQWRKALAERPENVRSLFELGLLYLETGRTVEAEPLIDQLDGLGRVGQLAAAMLRAERHVRMDDVASALRLLEGIIATGPPALEPRVMLSRLLIKHGADHEATEQAIRGVLALQPNHAEARRLLAALHDHRKGDGAIVRREP
jgi:tetratricopeptide (TPR) repeat protein